MGQTSQEFCLYVLSFIHFFAQKSSMHAVYIVAAAVHYKIILWNDVFVIFFCVTRPGHQLHFIPSRK